MTSRQALKGGAFERLIYGYLAEQLGPCVVRPRVTTADLGDIHIHPLATIEAKNYSDLARGVREGFADLPREQAAAGLPFGAVVVKRHGKAAPESQLVIMELAQWARLVREAMP